MTLLEKIRGYKTVIFNVAVALAGAIYGQEAVDAVTQLGLTTDQATDALVAVWAAANVALRAITRTPIGQRT